jgi:hypothetical protein
MVAKGEIRRKGRVLKAAMAHVQDGRPSFDCARCDAFFTQPGLFATEMDWRRYVRSTPIATLETDIRVPSAAEWGRHHNDRTSATSSGALTSGAP